MIDLVPDSERLARIFAQATAPTFFLGAVAGFVSLMESKLSAVMDRVRNLNAIADDDPTRVPLKADLDRLRRRARFLNSGIRAALLAGLCATLLLAIIFLTEFVGLKYAYGAGMLFIISGQRSGGFPEQPESEGWQELRCLLSDYERLQEITIRRSQVAALKPMKGRPCASAGALPRSRPAEKGE